MIEAVELSVTAPVPPARAFARFALELREWWPRQYTWSQDVLRDIGIEPRLGGLCFEIGPDRFRCDWGRVLAWDPPDQLVLAWHISPRREPVPNPAHCSRVAVRFSALPDGRTTVVALTHDAFERHGAEGAQYREAMASAAGWPLILQQFAAAPFNNL